MATPFVSQNGAGRIPTGQQQLRGSVLALSSRSGVGDRSSAGAKCCRARKASCYAVHEALVSRFYPLFVRSHASGHIRRPAARRRSAFRTPLPKQVWAPAPECAAWHLGAGPLARASPRGDPANPGIQTTETHHVSESHYAHRIPRQRRHHPHRQQRQLHRALACHQGRYKDKKTGEYNSHTEWHRCIVWGRLAEYAKTLTKGAHLSVEGELRSREQTNKKTNAKQRVWEVRVASILKLDRAEKVSPEEQEPRRSTRRKRPHRPFLTRFGSPARRWASIVLRCPL